MDYVARADALLSAACRDGSDLDSRAADHALWLTRQAILESCEGAVGSDGWTRRRVARWASEWMPDLLGAYALLRREIRQHGIIRRSAAEVTRRFTDDACRAIDNALDIAAMAGVE